MKTPCDYRNDGTTITAPGKFENEPIFTPHFWDIALEGFADSDDGESYEFQIDDADLADNLELAEFMGTSRTLRLVESESGFVRAIAI